MGYQTEFDEIKEELKELSKKIEGLSVKADRSLALAKKVADKVIGE